MNDFASALCFSSVVEVAFEDFEHLVPRIEKGLDWKHLHSTTILVVSRAAGLV